MNRKWFGIGLIFLGIILIGLFVYFFFIKPIRNGNGPGGSLPEVPFGQGGINQPGDGTIGSGDGVILGPDGSVLESEKKRQLLFQITDFPVTGYAPYSYQKEILDTVLRYVDVENPDGTVSTEEFEEEVITTVNLPRVRYHDKTGGLIYDTIIDNGLEEIQLTDSPITSMYESVFVGENRLFLRYFDEDDRRIKTYRGTLSSSVASAFCPYDFVSQHQIGDTGRDIEVIQSMISQVIVPTERLTPATFDSAMELAVKAFQKARGIKIDAVIKAETNLELQEVCLEVEQRKLENEIRNSDEAPYVFSGVFIDDNITQFVVKPDQEEIFRLIDKGDTAWGIISDSLGGGEDRIYDFDFRDWIVDWVAPDIISFTTKASGLATGSWYLYDLESKDLFNVLKNVQGLTTLASPGGDKALYAYSPNERTSQFGVIQVDSRTLAPLPVRTLPEKCVWSHDNINVYCMVPQNMSNTLYPDRWYQGEIIFDDTLWKINTQTNATRIIETFSSVNFDLDGVHLQINDDESFIFIIDQRTGYLWARDLIH